MWPAAWGITEQGEDREKWKDGCIEARLTCEKLLCFK